MPTVTRIEITILALLSFLALNCNAGEVVPVKDQSLSQALEQAAAAEARGDYRTAGEIYSKSANAYPDSAEVWSAFGEYLRFYAHDRKAATDAFNKAIAAKKKDAAAAAFALRGLGELAEKDGRNEDAEEYFTKSIKTFPLADTHRSLCHLYCRQRKFKEASEEARKAVELDGDDAVARLLYATLLQRSGEPEEGRRQFKRAMTASGLDIHGEGEGPVHCCVYYNAAGYLAVRKEDDAALKMLKKFLGMPNHRHLSRHEIETDPDFENLKELSAFQKLLDNHFPERDTAK